MTDQEERDKAYALCGVFICNQRLLHRLFFGTARAQEFLYLLTTLFTKGISVAQRQVWNIFGAKLNDCSQQTEKDGEINYKPRRELRWRDWLWRQFLILSVSLCPV